MVSSHSPLRLPLVAHGSGKYDPPLPVLTPKYPSAGPLSAAAAPLVDPAATPRPPPADPAALLARTIRTSAAASSSRASSRRRLPPAAAAPVDPAKLAALAALVDERVAEARYALDRLVVDPFQRRNKLPTAEQVFALLDETGALTTRSDGAIHAAHGAVAPAYADSFVTTAIDRVRHEMKALRDEVAPMLRALGPRVARLERLDAVLFEATAKGRSDIAAAALAPSLAKSFARAFQAAVLALPSPACEKADVARWFAEGGALRRELARGHAVATAVLAHERARVDALVRAAAEHESRPANAALPYAALPAQRSPTPRESTRRSPGVISP